MEDFLEVVHFNIMSVRLFVVHFKTLCSCHNVYLNMPRTTMCYDRKLVELVLSLMLSQCYLLCCCNQTDCLVSIRNMHWLLLTFQCICTLCYYSPDGSVTTSSVVKQLNHHHYHHHQPPLRQLKMSQLMSLLSLTTSFSLNRRWPKKLLRKRVYQWSRRRRGR